LTGGLGFDEWQVFQTEHLRTEQVSALARLARTYGSQGDFDLALAYTQRWLELDPLDELAYQQIMQLYLARGQRTEALRQYQACAQILRQEIDASPSAATVRLYQQAQQDEILVRAVPELSQTAIYGPDSSAEYVRRLPTALTPFVGRETEQAEIIGLLRDEPKCRLVTLIGPGGIGKTRLALQVAQEIGQAGLGDAAYPHGVVFVSLESIGSPEFLVPAIAQTLGFTLHGGKDAAAELFDYVREKTLLLVLDNVEHLLTPLTSSSSDLLQQGAGGVLKLLADVLQHAPGVKLLVTSREQLNLRGEWRVNLHGLSFPASDGPATTDIERYSAVQLFLQTARRVQPGFALSATNQLWIARICQLVDGIPLGIELAAAWVRMLTCEEIAGEIERSLEFLSTPLHDVPERQRSLRAVLDYTWRSLSPAEQQVFQRMSVFVGGFTQSAAEQVVGAALPVLLALVDKGLLRRQPSGRYDRHPLLWRLAVDQLNALPEEHAAMHDCHSAYYAALLARQAARLKGREQKAALAVIDDDIENVRVAWHWAVEHRREPEIAEAVDGLYLFYEIRGLYQEGLDAFGLAARQFSSVSNKTQTPLVGRLTTRQGAFGLRLGANSAARALLREGLSTLRHAGPEWVTEVAFALDRLGILLMGSGDLVEARHCCEESVTIFRRSQDVHALATALFDLGELLTQSGEYAAGHVSLEESIALAKSSGDLRLLAHALGDIGFLEETQKKYPEARAHYQECLSICQALGDRRMIGLLLNNMGFVAALSGEYAQAVPWLQQSLTILKEIGARQDISTVLDSLGYAMCGLGDAAAARRYYREGVRLAMDIQAISDALCCLVGMAGALSLDQQSLRALDVLVFALSHPKTPPYAKERGERLLAELAVHFSPEAIAQARARSQAKDLETVAAELLAD
jgi:predicted ATPase